MNKVWNEISDAVRYPNGNVEQADRYVNLEFRGEDGYEFGSERRIDGTKGEHICRKAWLNWDPKPV